jgi:hypothetical protein
LLVRRQTASEPNRGHRLQHFELPSRSGR